MLRHLLAASLALLLSAAPASALPNGFELAADCTVGLSGGEWDLPAGDQPGTVRGILVDSAGRKLGFEGVLTPVRTQSGIVRGRLDGALYTLLKDRFHPRPIASVEGIWVSGPEGRGRFRGDIVELQPGKSEKVVTATGKIAGGFSDLRSAELANPVGTFVCRWKICR
jgi:hypothetical protein